MASLSLLKDLSKAINNFLNEPSLPLPESLLSNINTFLQDLEEHNDAAAEQLQGTLLLTFDKRVKENSQSAGPWIAIIRRVLPVLRTPERILPWFDVCMGILDEPDVDKCVVDETVAALMGIVTLIDESKAPLAGDTVAKPVIHGLMELWMKHFYPALLDGHPASEHNERLVRHSLSNFGRKRPKELFSVIDGYFVQKIYRKSALRFLCDFIQGQPPHLHQVLDTPLFSDLLLCLQQDTSTTIASAALTTLIMLLPHMPSSSVPHLPALFSVYGRLLFWDREHARPIASAYGDGGTGDEAMSRWEVATFDAEVDDQVIAHLPHYFTILYGLYPINFMDYIRKPQRYMRHANASGADDLEVQPTEMRHRSERFRQNHLLHTNFYSLTIDSEKTDLSRWIKSEAAEVVAECMGLCLETDMYHFADLSTAILEPGAVHVGRNVDYDTTDGSREDDALLNGSSSKHDSWRSDPTASDSVSSNQTRATVKRRSTQSSIRSQGQSGDGEASLPDTGSPILAPVSYHDPLQDLIESNKAIKSGLHQPLANDSTPSLVVSKDEPVSDGAPTENLSSTDAAPPPPLSLDAPLPTSMTESPSQQVAHLQKLVLLLQNDLSFERYLKQQHMAHIGDIRRKQMSEAATEAETQNLIIMNRNLKSRFEDAKKSEMQAKKESERSRAIAKKWEAKLADKLKTLRDESQRAHGNLEALQKEVDECKSERDKLRKLLCAAEVKEVHFRQTMQSLEMDGTQVESLKLEVQRLTQSERDHQAREHEREKTMRSAAEARNEVEQYRMKLTALESDMHRTQKLFQAQIKALQAQLSEALGEHERPVASSSLAIETALAASRAKQAELQKQYSLLMRKYTVLQSSLLDMQSEHEQDQQRQQYQQQQQLAHAADYLSLSTSPQGVKSRPLRGVSSAEATGHNMTSPVGSYAGGSPTDVMLPSVHALAEGYASGSGSVATSTSPTSPEQRHLGRLHPVRGD
ncbi:hypothetical protein E4U45_004862 [Claviceps purpurea]|nr:hypothetical protein E4U45_004862 [Claviceps purpurea]